MRKLELLAPARNADIGIEAIRHGADAVYIGAPRFGARAAAGNSVEDIERLVDYAHQFGARVYVTLNTLVNDDELEDVKTLISQLYCARVDALIVQDTKIVKQFGNLISELKIPLHASTQMDNRTPEKVKTLHEAGFEQIVLARELTLKEIEEIHETVPDARLEVFVHGALCVSYSGCCYASERCFSRSANRGECAQMCRMEYDLLEARKPKAGMKKDDEDMSLLKQGKHMLSLKDLCLLDSLQQLVDAGATSFKIEGRLKDMSYVKNVTAAYHKALNAIVESRPDEFERTSKGNVDLLFTPDVRKSFNRGFTTYFLYGRTNRIFSFDTPKAMGEEVGMVKEIYRNFFTVAGMTSFHNGDGLCFVDGEGKLQGFRVNKVENGKLFPLEMPHDMCKNTRLFRNFDKQFEDTLQHQSAERYIPVDVVMSDTDNGFRLTMMDDYGGNTTINVYCQKELARTHQGENIRRQIGKMGGTPFRLRNMVIESGKNWFIPSSLLSQWKRDLIDLAGEANSAPATQKRTLNPVLLKDSQRRDPDGVLMTCKHCIKFSLGLCGKKTNPMFLQLENGIRFQLKFDCKNCQMLVYEAEK